MVVGKTGLFLLGCCFKSFFFFLLISLEPFLCPNEKIEEHGREGASAVKLLDTRSCAESDSSHLLTKRLIYVACHMSGVRKANKALRR